MLSTLNACILTVGSLLCFSEWPGYTGGEAFISSSHLWSHPVTFAACFAGYLQWDLCWCLYHHAATRDTPSLLHHSLFLSITHYVLYGWYFKKPFAWLSFTELSTPFLNARWMLSVLDLKHTASYTRASLAFALTFLFTRVVGYGLGLMDLWLFRDLWLPVTLPPRPSIIHACLPLPPFMPVLPPMPAPPDGALGLPCCSSNPSSCPEALGLKLL